MLRKSRIIQKCKFFFFFSKIVVKKFESTTTRCISFLRPHLDFGYSLTESLCRIWHFLFCFYLHRQIFLEQNNKNFNWIENRFYSQGSEKNEHLVAYIISLGAKISGPQIKRNYKFFFLTLKNGNFIHPA